MSRIRALGSLLGIGILLTVALVTLRSNVFTSQSIQVYWKWMLLTLVLDISLCWLGSQGWLSILNELGVREQAKDHLDNYWISQPFQFLGGVIGAMVGRLWLSKPLIVKNKTLASALLIEKSCIALANLFSLLTLTLLAYALRRRPDLFFIFNVILVLLAVAGIGLSFAKSHPHSPSKTGKARIAILYLVCIQSLAIFSLFTLTKALGVSSPLGVTLISRTYLVSWFLGQIAFFIPQGLGIREAIFAFLMRTPAGIPWSITYVLWARLLSISAQLIPILILGRKRTEVSGT